jgi:DNA-binding response OmpR family regulator
MDSQEASMAAEPIERLGVVDAPVETPLQFAGWVLDFAQQQLRTEAGETAHLTQAEFRILVALARTPYTVLTRDRLLGISAGRPWSPDDRSIDVHISNLRRKLDRDARAPSLIRTVRGAGYMLIPGA